MEKLKLIIVREYMAIVGKKSFIVMTLLMPFLIVLVGLIPIAIEYFNRSGSDQLTVAVVDNSGQYGGAIADDELYHFVPLTGADAADPRACYDKADGKIEAVVVIPADVDSVPQVTVYSENTIAVSLKSHITRQLSDTITARRIAAYGVPGMAEMVNKATANVDLKSVRWSADGSEEETSTEIALAIGLILAFVTYMFVLSYGAMIMNGVIEEKTNRIVEVVVSSCKPFQLMMGKIIGVGLVGLTQFAVWVVILIIVAMVGGSMAADSVDPSTLAAAEVANLPGGADAVVEVADGDAMSRVMTGIMGVNYVQILVAFVLYFIGGYLLYASLFAGFGSAVDQASDASQFTLPVVILMVIALYAGMGCIENPSGPMAFWCSMIPFTSPVVMMVRLPYDVPMWELALSVAILFGTAIAITWLAARIYRTGILRYGKKFGFKDIFLWIKG